MDLLVPREIAADDVVAVGGWLVSHGARVEADTEVVELTTSKATVVVEAGCTGYLEQECRVGDRLTVGARLGRIGATPVPRLDGAAACGGTQPAPRPPILSKAARTLMEQHGIAPAAFAGQVVVRREDVERLIGAIRSDDPRAPAIAASDEARLRTLLGTLRGEMRRRHQRHVPTGTLLHDRWQLAAAEGYGEGTSVYDECLILGDVVLGAHCWVGPFTVLDGSRGPLRIGDHTQIGSGSHVYTHHSIEQCLTGGLAPVAGAATTIGRCCFIAPHSIVGPGTVLGDHSFVASGSFVDGHFPAFSYLAGAPARPVGRVELTGDRARLIRDVP